MTTPRLWWLLERVQAALPMVAVAGLAGFTWWLVQSAPKEGGPARAPQVLTEPDYVLTHARVARFDATGRVVAVLDGERMQHRPDLDVLEIDAVQLTARDVHGRGLRATALRGVADPNAKQVTLQGQARVTAWPDLGATTAMLPDPLVFEGEDLLVDTGLRNLQSTRPVTLTRADSRIQGSALRYDHLTGITDLAGRVTGHYVPQGRLARTRPGQPRSRP
jgi:lipopolysaccharide export system protein LptC